MKHKYLNLNMGLVKENFAIVKRKDIKLWKSRGFEIIRRYPIFLYRRKISEVVMLGKPLTIDEFGLNKLKNSKIVDFSIMLGTYGMGGPGFVGFKLQGDFGSRWLVYCIWSAGEHILLDNRILECHEMFSKKYKPYIDFSNPEEYFNKLNELIKSLTIQDIQLSQDTLSINLIDNHSIPHTIHTKKASKMFPEQGGTEKKRNSYESGSMKDYWLVIYDNTELVV